MGLDINIINPPQVRQLKNDKNIKLTDSEGFMMCSVISYGDSEVGCYQRDFSNDDEYINYVRYVGSDYYPLAEYLFETYGSLMANDREVDDQMLYEEMDVINDEELNWFYMEYIFAQNMSEHIKNQKLVDIMNHDKPFYDKAKEILNKKSTQI